MPLPYQQPSSTSQSSFKICTPPSQGRMCGYLIPVRATSIPTQVQPQGPCSIFLGFPHGYYNLKAQHQLPTNSAKSPFMLYQYLAPPKKFLFAHWPFILLIFLIIMELKKTSELDKIYTIFLIPISFGRS